MRFMPWNLKHVVTFCVYLSSTDSQLKLWNVGKPYCLRSFKGHINEKNFVGLASNGDYIACGKQNQLVKGLFNRYLTAFEFCKEICVFCEEGNIAIDSTLNLSSDCTEKELVFASFLKIEHNEP